VILGLRANRLIWDREHRRFAAADGDPSRPIPMWRYRKSLRFWNRVSLGLLFIGWALGAVALVVPRFSREAIPSLLTLGVLVALFVYDQTRARRQRVAS